MLNTSQLRALIIETVGQLKCALTTGSQDARDVQVDNLMPDGGQDEIRQTAPFGFISAPPKGVAAFFLGLFGSRFEKMGLGFLDPNRPLPSGPGQTILYSTTPDGTQIQVTITLGSDGSLTFSAPTALNLQAPKVTISGDTTIALGSGGEATINGKTFITDYLAHTHMSSSPGNPTGPPIGAPGPTTYLSQTVTAQK